MPSVTEKFKNDRNGETADAAGIIGKDAESRANADRLSAQMPTTANSGERSKCDQREVEKAAGIARDRIGFLENRVDAEIAEVQAEIEAKKAAQDSISDLPKNFFMDESGVYYRGEKEPTFVCSPLRITAKTCDAITKVGAVDCNSKMPGTLSTISSSRCLS